jgi:hypothetical protein
MRRGGILPANILRDERLSVQKTTKNHAAAVACSIAMPPL